MIKLIFGQPLNSCYANQLWFTYEYFHLASGDLNHHFCIYTSHLQCIVDAQPTKKSMTDTRYHVAD